MILQSLKFCSKQCFSYSPFTITSFFTPAKLSLTECESGCMRTVRFFSGKCYLVINIRFFPLILRLFSPNVLVRRVSTMMSGR